MKKLALTSLLAVFAVSGANAANVISGNPLYRPDTGHFYSVTSLDMDTDYENFALGEDFGYGISDKMSLFMNTTGSYDSSDTPILGKYSWNNFLLGMSYRYLDQNEWKADFYGKVKQDYNSKDTLETTWYNWTAGTKFGYVMSDWTVAGTVEMNYLTDDQESFDYDAWAMKFGLEGQYSMDSNWNMVAGLDYTANMDDTYVIGNPLIAKLGVNYNMDATKYVGIYATRDLKADSSDDTYGMGVKFGIDF